ncbi:MAG: hypothetical protein DRJ35_02790 [Thermoprotei archaeon]|nr:MAG: hypothetical protein DRJ35_02790 [Thermoprotei archaeon]
MKILGEALKRIGSNPLTERYPKVKLPAPNGFRGRIVINEEKCAGCGACAMICPSKAIELSIDDDYIVVRVFQGRCILCGECVEACPFGAISFLEEYENIGNSSRNIMCEVKVKGIKCRVCGRVFISQRLLDHFRKILGEEFEDIGNLCPACREKIKAKILSTKIGTINNL